jgi:hypothetical protein
MKYIILSLLILSPYLIAASDDYTNVWGVNNTPHGPQLTKCPHVIDYWDNICPETGIFKTFPTLAPADSSSGGLMGLGVNIAIGVGVGITAYTLRKALEAGEKAACALQQYLHKEGIPSEVKVELVNTTRTPNPNRLSTKQLYDLAHSEEMSGVANNFWREQFYTRQKEEELKDLILIHEQQQLDETK